MAASIFIGAIGPFLERNRRFTARLGAARRLRGGAAGIGQACPPVQKLVPGPLAPRSAGEYDDCVLIWPRSRAGLPRPRNSESARRIRNGKNRRTKLKVFVYGQVLVSKIGVCSASASGRNPRVRSPGESCARVGNRKLARAGSWQGKSQNRYIT